MIRSALANTTSMSCSVNSTARSRSRTIVAGQRHQRDARARRHAGGRLVHQQQPRLVRQRHRQLDPLEIAVGEHARRRARPGPRSRPGRAAPAPRRDTGRPARGQRRARAPVVRDQRLLHVLEHGHRAEGLGDLEGAADAQAPDPARRQPDQLAPRQADAAGIGPDLAVQAVEAGGLAGAVRPDQRQKLAGLERESRRRPPPATPPIRLAQALDLEHRHQLARALPASLAWAKPTMPCGKASTSTTMIAPRTSGQ